MLTKTDLKSIRNIIREEVETEVQNVKDELQSEMKMNLVRTLSEIKNISGRLKNIEIKMNKLQKDLKIAVNFLDKEEIRIQERVDRIENHLNLPSIASPL